ncbi:MAG: ChbG/HpnK family deacetylase [Legionella sp.]|nr:ChbG/HpnK family deacetylase [Legionella sp.]
MTKELAFQPILLCADDYGQTAAISHGIMHLAEKKRINAISCLVNTDAWVKAAMPLAVLKEKCFIGLHLNLTWNRPLSKAWRHVYGNVFPRLPRLLRWCYNGRIDQRVIVSEIDMQLKAFYRQTGELPDFIDGHEHVHQFPQVREALLQIYQQTGLNGFLRTTINTSSRFSLAGFPKSQFIKFLGGKNFRRILIKRQIPTNTTFSGIYTFKKAPDYRQYFKEFLRNMKPGGLIMCHPGLNVKDKQDPIGLYRHYEYSYLMSETFLDDLASANCRLMGKEESFETMGWSPKRDK